METAVSRLPIVIWIVTWILLATWMALGTLTSTQFHNELQRYNDEIKDSDERKIPAILGLLERNLDRIMKLVETIENLNDELVKIKASEKRSTRELEGIAAQLANLDKQQEEVEKAQRTTLDEASRGTTPTLFTPTLPTSVHDDEFREIKSKSVLLEGERREKLSLLNGISSDKEALQSQLEDTTDAYNNHIKDKRLQLVQQIDTVSHLGFHVLFRLPRNLVILLTALAMGALGSAVFITRYLIYLDKDDPRPGTWYFIRPFQGMIMGLIMYLVANTGLFIFSDGKEIGEGLNPYTISVLAIVSGMLAEQAYVRIQQVGENVLSRKKSAT